MSLLPAHKDWFAIRLRSNFEQRAAQALTGRGLEVFLPTYQERRRWSDRIKTVQVPLFPGYLFCAMGDQDRLSVVSSPGVVQIVGHGSSPTPVEPRELEMVRRLVDLSLASGSCPTVQVGETVRLEQGPLAGVEGQVVRHKSGCRLLVAVTLLQRSVIVELDQESVLPVGASSAMGYLAQVVQREMTANHLSS